MKFIEGDFSTKVILEKPEPTDVCKLGQGEECCAFLVMSPTGFECVRMCYPTNMPIINALTKGTMNAKGEGQWVGCAWEQKE